MKQAYAAFDFGASSGRLVLGIFDEGKIQLREVHRFKNEPVELNGRLYWDFLRLFHEMKQGLKKVARIKDIKLESIGIDTWGVDGAWLDLEGQIISQPIHYRDKRTKDIIGTVHQKISEEALYHKTGIQSQTFNTIYQLYYDKHYSQTIKQNGVSWLFMPDLFGFMLTGKKYNEYSIASTGALIDHERKAYSKELFETLELPLECMQELVMPGTVVGRLKKELEEEIGIKDIKVIAVGSHDTASAIAATPLKDEKEVYLVCGTWCLMGIECKKPYLTDDAKKMNLTNEAGISDTIRLLKNINGLWFLQQLKDTWNDFGNPIDFPEIINQVRLCTHDYAIDPEDERFLAPSNMEQEVIAYCEEKYGITLQGVGEVAKAAYNGLGVLYKKTIEELEVLTQTSIEVIRMIGGGVKDEYLCEKVAEMTGKKVTAGPIEASSIGNILVQMMGNGRIHTLQEGRMLVEKSFETKVYEYPLKDLAK